MDVQRPASSVYWNQAARELLVAYHPLYFNPFVQTRLFAYLSIAQYNAIVAGEGRRSAATIRPSRQRWPPLRSRCSGASWCRRRHTPRSTRVSKRGWAARLRQGNGSNVADGLTIGQAIGAAVIAYASDGFGQTPAPANRGSWLGRNSVTGLYGTRLLVLESANQFRPLPPPAVGSATFQAAFDDLYAVVANRTPEQIQSAYDWAGRNNAAMNEVATNLILAHRTEREAARILALANMAGFDVAHACFDAKFAVLLHPAVAVRPCHHAAARSRHAEPPLVPERPLLHHLRVRDRAGARFPGERRELEAMVEAAGMSRMYAGFHYRFDLEAGQELGRHVGRYVLENGATGAAPSRSTERSGTSPGRNSGGLRREVVPVGATLARHLPSIAPPM